MNRHLRPDATRFLQEGHLVERVDGQRLATDVLSGFGEAPRRLRDAADGTGGRVPKDLGPGTVVAVNLLRGDVEPGRRVASDDALAPTGARMREIHSRGCIAWGIADYARGRGEQRLEHGARGVLRRTPRRRRARPGASRSFTARAQAGHCARVGSCAPAPSRSARFDG